MGRVAIIWNEHPNEVVAGFHAREVAKILRDKYDHEVDLIKVPAKETNYGIVIGKPKPRSLKGLIRNLTGKQKRDEIDEATRKASELFEQVEGRMERIAKSGKGNTIVVDFHASPAHLLAKAETTPAKEFSIGDSKRSYVEALLTENYRSPFEIEVNHHLAKPVTYVVEVPAHFEKMPGKKYARNKRLAQGVKDAMENEMWRKNWIPASKQSDLIYYTDRSPIGHPKQKKYLDKSISEKIAREINARVLERK